MPPRHFNWVGVGGVAYSITAVHTYVRPVHIVTKMVSVLYFLKRLVYGIQILYIDI